ncbi:hypothetical protein OPU71_18115 [Niveibacterium sp. 24ML]|uniref:hypothetical protein n=1 Tax=Niveibacterium sp. 24ML TaxID=2985512 RepID=UPI00226E1E67|nr:hypothetical protein [Niveibacterium sp. 24ML]MCX9158041.1 hypothetical protein [Niveibacterium sp. 24ML]
MFLQARILLNAGKRIPADVLRQVTPKTGLLEIKRAGSSGVAQPPSAFDPHTVARFWDPVPSGAKVQRQVFPPLYDPTIITIDIRGMLIAGFEWVDFDDRLRGMVRQAWWLQATSTIGGTPAP